MTQKTRQTTDFNVGYPSLLSVSFKDILHRPLNSRLVRRILLGHSTERRQSTTGLSGVVDVGDAFQFINHIMAERRRNTGRSGVGERRWRFNLSRRFNLSIIYRRFASSQRFVFFTRRRRRRVSIYQSYYGREEIKENRSEWCGGRALASKTIGRGFAPRQSLSFSHVDAYYGREEAKYSRSEWCGGRALAFKTIGRVFAPR